jgi:hypothetical protein
MWHCWMKVSDEKHDSEVHKQTRWLQGKTIFFKWNRAGKTSIFMEIAATTITFTSELQQIPECERVYGANFRVTFTH